MQTDASFKGSDIETERLSKPDSDKIVWCITVNKNLVLQMIWY